MQKPLKPHFPLHEALLFGSPTHELSVWKIKFCLNNSYVCFLFAWMNWGCKLVKSESRVSASHLKSYSLQKIFKTLFSTLWSIADFFWPIHKLSFWKISFCLNNSYVCFLFTWMNWSCKLVRDESKIPANHQGLTSRILAINKSLTQK